MSEHKEVIGGLFGDIEYVFTPMRDLIFGVFAGAIMTILVAFLQLLKLPLELFITTSFIILFIGILLTIFLARRYTA